MNSDNRHNGSRNITISDIARELNLSKTTISRAISGKGRIGEATRKKILDYIKLHNYKPNVIAKGLAQKKTFNIGVILPADANLTEIPFFQNCLMGICEAAAGRDYDVVVATATEDDITFLKRLIDNQKVDGIVLTRSLVNDLPVSYLKETGIPFVLIGSNEDDEIVQIDSNHTEGCCELTSILLKSGIKNIALLAGNQNHMVNRSRYAGFLKAYEDLGIEADDSIIFPDMNNNILIQRAVGIIMSKGADCIICSDDYICSRALATLEEEGYSIPKDITIASFYNSVNLENHNPPVTALKINVKELGITAGKTLINMISGEGIEQRTWVNYEIAIKKSTS